LLRNRTGRKDNLLLGRVYRDMLAARQIANRELAETLAIFRVAAGRVAHGRLDPTHQNDQKGGRLKFRAGSMACPGRAGTRASASCSPATRIRW
jgi:hypothetical protein